MQMKMKIYLHRLRKKSAIADFLIRAGRGSPTLMGSK